MKQGTLLLVISIIGIVLMLVLIKDSIRLEKECCDYKESNYTQVRRKYILSPVFIIGFIRYNDFALKYSWSMIDSPFI